MLPAARIPEQDARNVVLHSRTHHKTPVFASREAWLERAAFLRKQTLASAGLRPMPEKTPLNAQIFGQLTSERRPLHAAPRSQEHACFQAGPEPAPVAPLGPRRTVIDGL